MPYSIRKLPNQDLYRVYNKQTKVVHSYSTTLANAKKQVTLLNMVDAGVPLKKKGKGARFSARVQPEEDDNNEDDDEDTTISINEDAAREAARIRNEEAEAARRREEEARRLRIEAARANAEANAKAKREAAEKKKASDEEARIMKLYDRLDIAKSIYMAEYNEIRQTKKKAAENGVDVVINYTPVDRAMNSYLRLRNQLNITNPKDPEYPVSPNEAYTMKEIEGEGFGEDGEVLKPFFGRVGSKVSLIKEIIPIIHPHTTYVEAFVGGGSIFWNKIPAKKSVINDLDKNLVDGYKLLKKVPVNADLTKFDGGYGDKPQIKKINEALRKINSSSSVTDKLIKHFKLSRGTFNAKGSGELYTNKSGKPYEARLPEYKRLLKNTTITNQNYISVIKKYDSPTTFFFLDPPYEGSKGLYKDDTIDYYQMSEVLKNIKGKFLLTINDSKEINEIFKGFNKKKVSVNTANNKIFETQNRKELFISNYTFPKKGGSIETDRFEEDGIVSLPKFRSVKINLPTYMYKKLPDINGKPPPYKYKLVVPITSSRNISSRKQETSLDISQKPVSKPNVVIAESEEQPNINDFSPADKAKIQAYYDKVAENEDENPDEIDKDEYVIKPRGKPLPCSKGSAPKEKRVVTKKPETPSVKAMVAAIDKPKSKPKSFTLTDEQSADLYLEDEAAFDLYNSNLEEFKKKYKGKYGKKFGFGLANKISANSNMANSWITYVKSYAAKNGMSYRDALRDPKCKAGYRKEGSGASMGMKAKIEPDTTPSTNIPVGTTPVGRRVSPATATAVSNVKNPLTKQQRTRTKVMDLRQASQTMASKIGRGIVNEMAGQALVAMAYNDSELGANAGRKFISL